MGTVQILVSGDAAEQVAAEIESILTEGTEFTAERRRLADLPEPERKIFDPVTLAVAGLVISVPAAVLAVMQVTERIGKRRRANALAEKARTLRAEKGVEIKIVVTQTRSLADLDADGILELITHENGAASA